MRKLMVTGVALLGLLAGLGAAPADARDRDRWSRHYASDWAWDAVRSDPCRYDEYRDYARKHENPRKRARKIEELAREGCSRRYARAYYDDDRWHRGRYADRYDDDRYDDDRYYDDRYERRRFPFPLPGPLRDLFGR